MPYKIKPSKTPNNQNRKSISEEELADLKVSVLAAQLAYSDLNKGAEKKLYKESLEALKKQLGEEVEPIPFYKGIQKNRNGGGINVLAGYVIPTSKGILITYHGTQPSKYFDEKNGPEAAKYLAQFKMKRVLNRFKDGIFGTGAEEIYNDLNNLRTTVQFQGNTKDFIMHKGFYDEYMSSKDNLFMVINNLEPQTRAQPIKFSGHSLGAAACQIAALDFAKTTNFDIGSVQTFGGPRVFSPETAKEYDEILGDKTLRVMHKTDLVARIPPWGLFQHAGRGLQVGVFNTILGSHDTTNYTKLTNKVKANHKIIGETSWNYAIAKAFESVKQYAESVKHATISAFKQVFDRGQSRSSHIPDR
ncbi:MAG: hypothetical protein SFT91_02335 [Rickettsiaceae bacterium]|nr:hypothetical protein [Rickettsiaceae bacterium]